ncbi:hypothetical protein SSX86_022290 [Deinandra increscens subsp. villosa]|uniref:BHLH domain-containing protein n=1 Tax=Deinandra increscens subsp. villosa TaxID=3103831 RepID=A0AAP0CNR7_9ASTR
MDRDFFLDSGLQFEPPWKLMTLMPEVPEIPISDGPIWDKLDQFGRNSQFESALSSIVSSPVSEFRIRNSIPLNPDLPCFGSDPGFAERAAKFSCFGSRSFNAGFNESGLNLKKTEDPIGSDVFPAGKFHRVSSSPVLKTDGFPVGFEEMRNSDENKMKLSRLLSCSAAQSNESSVSEQIPSGELGYKNRKHANSRKRKGGSSNGGVGSNTKTKTEEEDDINDLKRVKKTEQENGGKMEEKTKEAEPPKDYIHVRARRGQATDSHSLAERVRREKIGERMKLLQSLVPNCNKVTGKALMLDEIINYVQSLQSQVEFLSMKLATVNPSVDIDTNDLISQNVNKSNGNLSNQTSASYQQNAQGVFDGSVLMTQPVHEFTQPFSYIQGFDRNDLQSIVQNLDLDTSFYPMTHDQSSNLKIEQ